MLKFFMPLAGKEIIKYSDILNENSLEIKKLHLKSGLQNLCPILIL